MLDKITGDKQLTKCNEEIRNFDRSSVNNIIGKFKTTMLFQGREATTSMYITRSDTISTIGTDLIQMLEIDICGKTLQICTTNAVDNITNMHPKLLDESLGTFPNSSTPLLSAVMQNHM